MINMELWVIALAVGSCIYSTRERGLSELVVSRVIPGHVSFQQARWGPWVKMPRGSRMNTILFTRDKQCWARQPLEGRWHTDRDWVSLSNRCCRNHVLIGLEEMMSEVASHFGLLMLHTFMPAQGKSSPVLGSLKSPVSFPRPQDSQAGFRK